MNTPPTTVVQEFVLVSRIIEAVPRCFTGFCGPHSASSIAALARRLDLAAVAIYMIRCRLYVQMLAGRDHLIEMCRG
jgi:hypothetical protein